MTAFFYVHTVIDDPLDPHILLKRNQYGKFQGLANEVLFQRAASFARGTTIHSDGHPRIPALIKVPLNGEALTEYRRIDEAWWLASWSLDRITAWNLEQSRKAVVASFGRTVNAALMDELKDIEAASIHWVGDLDDDEFTEASVPGLGEEDKIYLLIEHVNRFCPDAGVVGRVRHPGLHPIVLKCKCPTEDEAKLELERMIPRALRLLEIDQVLSSVNWMDRLIEILWNDPRNHE